MIEVIVFSVISFLFGLLFGVKSSWQTSNKDIIDRLICSNNEAVFVIGKSAPVKHAENGL